MIAFACLLCVFCTEEDSFMPAILYWENVLQIALNRTTFSLTMLDLGNTHLTRFFGLCARGHGVGYRCQEI